MKKATFLLALILMFGVAISQEASDTTKKVLNPDAQESPMDTLTRSVSNLIDDNIKAKRLKITGYVQPQYQYIDSAGAESFAGGDFKTGGNNIHSRFTMRRARFKFTYTYDNVQLMVNIDARETGLGMRETYAKITDKKWKTTSLTLGLLQTQFGFELNQSSGERESVERARFNQILFPVERDLGAFGSFVAPKSSKLFGLKVDVGMMNGVGGVNPEFDNFKDFTGRLQYTRSSKSEKVLFAFAGSYYHGGYQIGNQKDYIFAQLANGEKGFTIATYKNGTPHKARREYYGADAQISIDGKIGITTLRAEYIVGAQPGTNASNQRANNSPGGVITLPIYHRHFNGAYFTWVQDIGHSKFQAVLKYDWFDPNTKISKTDIGKDIGKGNLQTNAGDIRFDTYGFGINYHINAFAKVCLYYDIVKNEVTQVFNYKKDVRDNVFTLRFQVKY